MKMKKEKKEIFESLEKEKLFSLPELKKEEKELREKLLAEIEKKEKEFPLKEKKKEEETLKEEIDFFKDPSLQQKIALLLRIAQKKGILYSIQLVRKTKNPLLLDLYHDYLAKEGFFKKFFFK